MSDEHDSWFKNAFGVDLGQVAQGIQGEATAAVSQVASTVTQVVQGVQGAVEGAIDNVTGAVTGVVKKVSGAVLPSGAAGGASGAGGTGSFPLGGSVGRGGKNASGDVRAVQAALGLSVDGQCGPQTISAIEAFQRSIGQAKPDGRVDAGAATERSLAGGGRPSPAQAPLAPSSEGVDSPSALSQVSTVSGLPPTNAGILETAEAALIAVGEVTGISGAARQVEAVASGAAKTAEQAGAIVAEDPLSAAAGLGFGAVQGLAPGGFLLPSPNPDSKAFELGRGVGLIGGGIAAVALGGSEEVVGTALDATGVGAIVGVPVNVLGAVTIASGVTAAGVGVATVGGVLATSGGGGPPAKGTPTEVDPPRPAPEPEVPKTNVPLTPEQARQNLLDAVAKQKATEKASREATEEFVRFRALKPNPARGVEGDPSKFDPVVSDALEDQMLRAQRENEEAIVELRAAQQAARDAAGQAKGARGGGGFPPPRK